MHTNAEGISFSLVACIPTMDSAILHALKWEEANDSTKISLRTMAFNLNQ